MELVKALASKVWDLVRSLSGQAYQSGTMIFLVFVGIFDMLSSVPYPPELGSALPRIVFFAYGLYLTVGALFVLAGSAYCYKTLAIRVERTGHIMVATALLFFAGALGFAAMELTEHFPTEDNEDFLQAVRYLSLAAAFIVIQSVARWIWLGKRGYRKVRFAELERGDKNG